MLLGHTTPPPDIDCCQQMFHGGGGTIVRPNFGNRDVTGRLLVSLRYEYLIIARIERSLPQISSVDDRSSLCVRGTIRGSLPKDLKKKFSKNRRGDDDRIVGEKGMISNSCIPINALVTRGFLSLVVCTAADSRSR